MDILVDADALVALAKRDDQNHNKAKQIAKRVINDTLYISPLAIPEAATVLSHKVSQQVATKFLQEARKKRFICFELTTEMEREADKVFLKETKNGTSWPDCLNIAYVKQFHLGAIFSFDAVYKRYAIAYV